MCLKKNLFFTLLLLPNLLIAQINIDSLKIKAETGDLFSKAKLGEIYQRGLYGIKRDNKKALDLFQNSLGNPISLYRMGVMYKNGYEVGKDSLKAKDYFVKAVRLFKEREFQELPEYQYDYALCYYEGDGVEKDLEIAVKWLKKAAKLGYSSAQYFLGICYYEGTVVEKDYSIALEWFNKSAKQKYASAQYIIGHCYYYGTGVIKDYSLAIEWFRKSAKQNNENAQNKLGSCYYDGIGVTKDYKIAVEWYEKSAKNGYSNSQLMYGMCHYNGNGIVKDFKKAVEWFKKSAMQENSHAQNMLGICYKLGNGVTKDTVAAMEWFKKAALQEHSGAQNTLGRMYYYGDGVPIDFTKAVEWFEKAATQGHKEAQNTLGYCYFNGQGVDKDYSIACQWYQKSAEQGNAYAQFNLGNAYYYGNGVTKDYNIAADWYKKAADQGHKAVSYSLGNCYYNGFGVTKDYVKAVELFEKSAETGDFNAQNMLGTCYYFGNGVPKDKSIAFEWYNKSAKQGHMYAQHALGICYYNGFGVLKDEALAFEWIKKAAKQGNANAKNFLKNYLPKTVSIKIMFPNALSMRVGGSGNLNPEVRFAVMGIDGDLFTKGNTTHMISSGQHVLNWNELISSYNSFSQRVDSTMFTVVDSHQYEVVFDQGSKDFIVRDITVKKVTDIVIGVPTNIGVDWGIGVFTTINNRNLFYSHDLLKAYDIINADRGDFSSTLVRDGNAIHFHRFMGEKIVAYIEDVEVGYVCAKVKDFFIVGSLDSTKKEHWENIALENNDKDLMDILKQTENIIEPCPDFKESDNSCQVGALMSFYDLTKREVIAFRSENTNLPTESESHKMLQENSTVVSDKETTVKDVNKNKTVTLKHKVGDNVSVTLNSGAKFEGIIEKCSESEIVLNRSGRSVTFTSEVIKEISMRNTRSISKPKPKVVPQKVVQKSIEVPVSSTSSQGTAKIFISSLPPMADVYMDGKRIGRTNMSLLPVTPGTHEMRFVKGSLEKTVSWTFKAGKNPSKMVRLK